MRAVITGQIGLDKKQYLDEACAIARSHGETLKIYHIGEMMYREAPDVPAGRILDLPLSRLNSLRRAVFRDILAEMPRHKNVIINTHATFRWKHGLFAAFDFDQLALFDPDLFISLVDNIETVHARMLRDHPPASPAPVEHTLKDLMVWREEEILATEILAKANLQMPAGGGGGGGGGGVMGTNSGARFYVLSRGRNKSTAETLFRLLFRPAMKKVYPSFPMTHIHDLPEVLGEVNAFRAALAEKFVTFDPGDVDEKLLGDASLQAAKEGQQHLRIPNPIHEPGGRAGSERRTFLELKVSDLLQILPDIDGQIYSRDFLLVRQSDIIVSFIPEIPMAGGGGKPGLSSGVERELQHAHDHAKDVYVIWKPHKDPSPFITQTANRVFKSIDEAMQYFEQKGYFQMHNLFGG